MVFGRSRLDSEFKQPLSVFKTVCGAVHSRPRWVRFPSIPARHFIERPFEASLGLETPTPRPSLIKYANGEIKVRGGRQCRRRSVNGPGLAPSGLWTGFFGLNVYLLFRFSATASRMRFFSASSSNLSFSLMSMARLTFPSRLELNRPEGSLNAAPLKNVSLTTFS